MDTLRPPENGAEKKDFHLEDEAGFGFASASLPSVIHPDRNEDTILGDPTNAEADRIFAPRLETMDLAADDEAIGKAIDVIAEHAETLRKKRIVAVLDGISGRGSKGTGAIASRLAGAAVSERLAQIPELLPTDQAKEVAADALMKADMAVWEYRAMAERTASPERLAELAGLGTTLDLVMFAEGADGGTDAVIAHCGDSRIYRFVASTEELELLTTDENLVGLAFAQGKIGSREEYEAHAGALSLSDLPEEIRKKSPFKDEYEFGRASSSLTAAIGAGIAEPERRVTAVRVAKGDKIMVCSDGIHDNLSGKALRDLMKAGATAKNMAKSAEGAYMKADDISLVIVEVGELSEVRKKREETKEHLRKKIQWTKSAAATIGGSDARRAEAMLLGARKDEVALLTLTKTEELETMGLTETSLREKAREMESTLQTLDQARPDPNKRSFEKWQKARIAKMEEVERFTSLVADLDRIEAMLQEIEETAARLKDADEDAIRAARKNIDE